MQGEENWTCREDQKICALVWTDEQIVNLKMNPLRYIGEPLLKGRLIKKDTISKAPDDIRFCKFLYSQYTLIGRGENWISVDGITQIYYSKKLLALETHFSDGSAIVSMPNKGTKPRIEYLGVESNFSDTWRLHREKVRDRIQSVNAIERFTPTQFIAYDKYWSRYRSSLQIPLAIIVPVITFLLMSLYTHLTNG